MSRLGQPYSSGQGSAVSHEYENCSSKVSAKWLQR